MNTNLNDWVRPTSLSSPITGLAVLLVGRDGVSPTRAIGSGVFIAPGLIMTVKHVIKEFWKLFEDPNVEEMEEVRKKKPGFEMFAVQMPEGSASPALWAASFTTMCPYSDLAVISVVPADGLAKANPAPRLANLNILPPAKGTQLAMFGYADSSVKSENGDKVEFQVQPRTSIGEVTDVYPVARDLSFLSFPSFAMQTYIIGGMSGGPVFNRTGDLCGLICTGDEANPYATGVVLWPMFGIPIKHQIPGLPSEVKYPMFQLAQIGLMHQTGWDYVNAHAEEFVDAKGRRRMRLKS
jgi:Trypsin-like peptidase domain